MRRSHDDRAPGVRNDAPARSDDELNQAQELLTFFNRADAK
jgi:hypothetical protein